MSLPEGFEIVSQPKPQSGLPEGFEVVQPEPEQSMVSKGWNAVKDAYEGNAQFKEAGGVSDYIKARADDGYYSGQSFWSPEKDVFKDLNKVNDAGTFGNVQDTTKALKEIFNDAEIMQDENGNPYTEYKGKQYYMNPPGLDLQDVSETAGEGIAYSAGGLGGTLAKTYGLFARALGTGAAETGINYVAQKMAGRDEVDKTEMAVSGLAGGLFEGLTPVVSAAWRKIKNAGVSDVQAGTAIAQKLGAELNPDQTKLFGKMVKNLDPDQVTPETILAHIELNQTPTRGTLTKNKDILDTENMLRQSGRESTRNKLKLIDDANETGLRQSMGDFQDNLSGGKSQATDYLDAAGQMNQAVNNQAKAAKQGVNEAYDGVQNAYLGSSAFSDAPRRIKKALSSESMILDPSITPRVTAAIGDLEKSIAKIEGTKGVSWQAVDGQRKRISSMFSGANPTEKKALTIMQKEYDSIVDDAFENALLSGSPETIANLKNARSVASDYFKKYSKNGKYDDAGKVIEKWVNSKQPPEKIANAIFNTSGSLGQNAIPMAKRYLEIVGKDTAEHNLLKEMAMMRFAGDKTKAQMRTNLKKAMTNQPTFMSEVFTPKELGFLSRTVSFIDDVSQKGVNAATSGTSERFFRWANKSVGSDVSLSGMLNTMKKAADMLIGGERRVFSLPTQQLALNPLSGAAAQTSNSTQANGL